MGRRRVDVVDELSGAVRRPGEHERDEREASRQNRAEDAGDDSPGRSRSADERNLEECERECRAEEVWSAPCLVEQTTYNVSTARATVYSQCRSRSGNEPVRGYDFAIRPKGMTCVHASQRKFVWGEQQAGEPSHEAPHLRSSD